MLRRAAGKAMWLGGKVSAVFGLALALALVLGIGTAALAAVPGDPFRLGRANVVNNALTALVGSRAGGAMMLVDNNSSAPGSRALDLRTEPGRAPLTVNPEAGKAAGLNADRLDNRDGGAYFSGETYTAENGRRGLGGGAGLGLGVVCDPGDKVLGGGGSGNSFGDVLGGSRKIPGEEGWAVFLVDEGNPTSSNDINVLAVCADFPPRRNP